MQILKALTRKFSLAPDLDLADISNHCPFHYTGADFYALCSDATPGRQCSDAVDNVNKLIEDGIHHRTKQMNQITKLIAIILYQ